MGREENIAVVKKYTEAINQRDIDSFLSAFAPDAEWLDPVGAPGYVGHEQIRRGIQGFWDALPSLTLTPMRIIAEGNYVVSEVACDEATAEGKRAHHEAVDIFEIKDGKIKTCYAYYDPGWISRQLAE
jgi:uncharacterized protein (TIGR02246 family)